MQPEEIDAVLDRANRLLEEGKPDESLECLSQLEGYVLDSEDRIEWASLRAWALSEIGRDEDALETLDVLLEEFPKSARLLGTLGVVLSNTDDLEDARDALEEAVSISPTDEVSLANLALVHEKLRDYDRALELYERALNLGADIDWVLQRKAAALIECGRYSEAKSTLMRYLSLVPDDAAQWIALGILHSDDEEYEQAFQCYAEAEKYDADAPALRLNWGVTAVRARQLATAREQLDQLEQLEPESTRPALLRAFVREEEGNLVDARRIYDQVLADNTFLDRSEQTYALEMAMDFFARHKLRGRCERVLRQAYDANACTVELCEAYRESRGRLVEEAYWFSLMVEADYRPGLVEVYERTDSPPLRYTRFMRDYQVIALDRDEAISAVLDLMRRMGESNPSVREFMGEEQLKNAHTGVYEVETESLVFNDDQLA